jgi:Lrp/AsnC family leucine-responsive transcriptional regulator
VDEIDERLLAHLRRDGRASMASLGRAVGLSRTAALARVRRLEAEGVIRGYRADVADERQAPAHVARVAVVLRTPDIRAYVRRLLALPEVTEVESVAGEYDLLVGIATDRAGALDDVLDRLASWRETVRTTTFVVLTHYDP